jgi:hypothetical protein
LLRTLLYLPVLALLAAMGSVCGGCDSAAAGELPVPRLSEVARVDRDGQAPPEVANTSTFILKTSAREPLGNAYVIVTDQTDDVYLRPLEKLAKFHQGTVLRVKDLGRLADDAATRDKLKADLQSARPRYVAIAPKLESFRETMLTALWDVLAGLDDKHSLAAFPGLLVAPDQESFAALVDRSIAYHPQPVAQVRPFVMGQVMGPMPPGMRSLQKVRMMRNLFAEFGRPASSLVIRAYSAVQSDTTVAPAPNEWQVDMDGPGQYVKTIPAPAKPALDDASLLLMYGHGVPGMACSLDVGAFHDVKMTGKVVLCGACYSAGNANPNSPPATGGSFEGQPAGQREESFALRAVQNGAVVVFAHLRENEGFPHLYPMLEGWMNGLTVGEAYQRLLNALIAEGGVQPGANRLLYVVIGDPALQPLEKMTPVKP